jgi:hypothetical protein
MEATETVAGPSNIMKIFMLKVKEKSQIFKDDV